MAHLMPECTHTQKKRKTNQKKKPNREYNTSPCVLNRKKFKQTKEKIKGQKKKSTYCNQITE